MSASDRDDSDQRENEPVRLARRLNLPLLTIYGLGTMVGGGFYALVGKVSGESGMHAPVAFLTAAVLAGFTALSFGELAARYPYSAGASYYAQEAFDRRWLSITIGWLVVLTGVVSAATLANAFTGFLQDLVTIPTWVGVVGVVISLSAIAMWGIGESVGLAVAITVIEVGGLVFVLGAGGGRMGALPERLGELIPAASFTPWPGILVGAFIAFYSLIGFEDMVTVAEEVKEPTRTIPRALILSLALTTLIYVLVATIAVLTVEPETLAESRTPLATVVRELGYPAATEMTLISMLAGLNGALVQIIMASRMIYGMASKDMGWTYFEKVSETTRTPLRATILTMALVLVFALWLPLVSLARLTSAIILVIFSLVNLALVVIQRREGPPEPGVPSWPTVVPLTGFVLSAAFLVVQLRT